MDAGTEVPGEPSRVNATGVPSPAGGMASAAESWRLFVIGDSISIDYGPALERRLGPRFTYDRKRDEGEDVGPDPDEPRGANGGDSGMVLRYLQRRAATEPITADVLVVNAGLHDLRVAEKRQRRVAPDDYANNLRAIVRLSREGGYRLVWINTIPVAEQVHNIRCTRFQRFASDVELYNWIAEQVMRTAGVPIVDLHGFTAPFLPQGLVDHVHLDETTRTRQAAFLAASLQNLASAGQLGPARGAVR
ncbi:MAG TPA: SGNH/GDSL hydrolase family protein [Opitutaceae bacterium]|nr:SGNH/GDSL hydrolase family protein [Opitutaceae bacterium]